MKKILYIGGFCLPDRNAAAQRVISNSKIFRELGYEVTLVGLDRKIVSKDAFDYEGFKCVNLPYPNGIVDWLKMLTSIKQYIPYINNANPDIVIAYNHPALALNRLSNFNRKKGIITVSDCTEWYEPQGGVLFRLIKGWDINQRMYKVHCKLDGIITISRYLDDFYQNQGMKTLLLPPLVDKHESKWNVVTNNDVDVLSLIYAGSPAGTKDRLDYMIDALQEVSVQSSKFQFNIVGITEDEYRSMYWVDDNKAIPPFVHFYGRVPHGEVIKMLKSSDFQIFLRENHLANQAGFPTKFTETISAGIIVLTNPSSNIQDYMIEGVNSFLLDISDKEKLVKTLSIPLSLHKTEILKRKSTIDSYIFDYRNYISLTENFVNSLYEKNT